jgi:hypothetical protein
MKPQVACGAGVVEKSLLTARFLLLAEAARHDDDARPYAPLMMGRSQLTCNLYVCRVWTKSRQCPSSRSLNAERNKNMLGYVVGEGREERRSLIGAMAAQVPCIPIEPDKQGLSRLFGCRLPFVCSGRKNSRDFFGVGRTFPSEARRHSSGIGALPCWIVVSTHINSCNIL